MRWVIVSALACLSLQAFASGEAAFTLSGGYSHVYSPPNNLWHNKDGGYIDGELLFRLPTHVPLLIGGGISGSGYYSSDHFTFTDVNGFLDDARLQSDLGFFSIEGRIGIPISSPRARGPFLLPKIGVGLLINSYSVDQLTNSTGVSFIDTVDHTGAAFEIRPALQAGFSWGWGSVGGEISYMAAWGDFGQLGNRSQEFRAGVFARLRF